MGKMFRVVCTSLLCCLSLNELGHDEMAGPGTGVGRLCVLWREPMGSAPSALLRTGNEGKRVLQLDTRLGHRLHDLRVSPMRSTLDAAERVLPTSGVANLTFGAHSSEL